MKAYISHIFICCKEVWGTFATELLSPNSSTIVNYVLVIINDLKGGVYSSIIALNKINDDY